MNQPAFVLAFALSACVPHAPPEGAPVTEPVQATAPTGDGALTRMEHEAIASEVLGSLERLRALDLLVVGALIVEAPEGAQNCYGPCADDPVGQAWMQEHARQAERLAELVEHAEQIAAAPAEPLPSDESAVDALRALQIVEITGMHYEGTGNCYVGQCPGDAEKRGRVAALAEAASEL